MLSNIVDDSRTDKNTTHSYLPLYQNLLESKQYSAKNVLEIGIGDYQGISNGGSIKLWHDFFVNADIYALDIQDISRVWDGIKDNNRIKLVTSTNAYDETFFNSFFTNKDLKFDVLLDDGPHTLESMLVFIKLYSQLMTDDGILIIEDVQSWDWIEFLKNQVPDNLKQYINVYDLRNIKGRYDDIVFTIDKSKPEQ